MPFGCYAPGTDTHRFGFGYYYNMLCTTGDMNNKTSATSYTFYWQSAVRYVRYQLLSAPIAIAYPYPYPLITITNNPQSAAASCQLLTQGLALLGLSPASSY